MSLLVMQARIRIGNFRTHPRRSCQLGTGGLALAASLWRGGVERFPREGSRKHGKAHTPLASVARVVALTCSEPPGEVTHWTGRAMAKITGRSLTTIQPKPFVWAKPANDILAKIDRLPYPPYESVH